MSRQPSAAAALVLGFAVLASPARAQLPAVPFPPENPYTVAKATLGKILFWEEQMSCDNTQACGTCHTQGAGGGDPRTNTPENVNPGPDGIFGTADDIRGSRGVVRSNANGGLVNDGVFYPNAQVTGRKAPSAIGAMFAPVLFWDGRADSKFTDPSTTISEIQSGGALESQSVGPIVSPVEMGCNLRTHGDVTSKIAAVTPMRLAQYLTPDISAALAAYPTYPSLFQWAFGDPAVTTKRIAFAIATYERTLVPDQTPFDAYSLGNQTALTPAQINGLNVFVGIGNCGLCHIPPEFTDHSFANIGVRPIVEDLGRSPISFDPNDDGAFRVPSLRNVGLRAPFFHNGGKATMTDVVNFYMGAGDFHVNQDPRILPLTLTHPQQVDLADFLQNALTDPRVAAGLPPFDRPALNSEFSNGPVEYGFSTVGSGGFAPTWSRRNPPFTGNTVFAIGVAKALGGSPALLAISDAPDYGTYGAATPIWVSFGANPLFIDFTLDGTYGVAGVGSASMVVDIPAIPSLAGYTAFCQWAVLDNAGPDGVATTPGLAVTLF